MVCRKRKTSTCHFKKHPPPPRAPEAPTICHVIPRTPPRCSKGAPCCKSTCICSIPKTWTHAPPSLEHTQHLNKPLRENQTPSKTLGAGPAHAPEEFTKGSELGQ